tara:strand:+ start:26145 stop:27275 length:1131 start_codon:yes stop_codon:yes gene_type:complete
MKRFKDMFEDAPVNATGDAVATNEPIVRKKKKKEDSSGREIGTPELLKRYMDDTPGQSIKEANEVEMILPMRGFMQTTRKQVFDWAKKAGLKPKKIGTGSSEKLEITGTGDQIKKLISYIPVKKPGKQRSFEDTGEHPPHVKDKEKEKKKVVLKGSLASVHEARLMTDGKLVTTVDAVLGSILKKLKSEMGKRYKKDKKDGMAYINSIAKMVGMTATDKGQQKGKLFLRLGEDLEEGLWDNIRKKRARGEKMRKKGEKGAPTQDQIKRAQEECCAECLGHYDHMITEAEYQGKKVTLNDPIRTSENPNKKFKVYVKGESGKVVVVRFGDPKMGINRDNPERRKSFRARHNCADPGPKWKARYWSCYQWRASAKVDN